jgi:hypothetical protein
MFNQYVWTALDSFDTLAQYRVKLDWYRWKPANGVVGNGLAANSVSQAKMRHF